MKALILAALVLLAILSVVPSGDAKPLDPQCMPVYSRTDVGQLSIVRRDSCHAEYYWCPYEGAPVTECDPLIG
jgi:hypothetical protein